MGPPLAHAPSTSCCRPTNPSPLGGGPLALQAAIARWPSRPWSRHDQGLAVVGLGGLDTGAWSRCLSLYPNPLLWALPIFAPPLAALPSSKIVIAHPTIVAAFTAAKATMVAGCEKERVAAHAWEHELTMADALARHLVEAERHLTGSPCLDPISKPPMVEVPLAYEAIVTNIHAQATGVQNTRSLLHVLLDPTSCTYTHWCDLVLTLQHYALDDHVLIDTTSLTIPSWRQMDSVVLF